MKQESSYTAGEASIGVQRTQSPMLLLPPNITCNLTQEEEKELAQKIAEQGDESATIKLYSCCLEDVFHYFYRKTWGDVPETENMTQETLIRAMQGLRNGFWSGQLYRPWLFGIARNVFLEWLRAKPKNATQKEQLEQVDLLDEVLIRERGTTLWGLVRELPRDDKQLLALRYIHGLRYADIATMMSSTENACKTRHWRALNQLREKILQEGLGEELGFGKRKHHENI